MAASMSLLPGPDPSYRFLPGGEPYSSGAVATPGWEVIHATLQAPVPWREGFAAIERHLRALGRPRTALCAIELRIPTPLTFAGFAEFNRGYRALLGEWGLLVDGRNPVARTNVAPVVGPPAEPSLYAFSYTVAAEEAGGPTFVAAGSGELRPGPASRASVVRPDETSADALREKAAHVMGVMQARLTGLGATWADVTAVGVYTVHPLESFLATEVLAAMGPAGTHGVHWYLSHPPIAGLAYEMDLRGVRREVRLPAPGPQAEGRRSNPDVKQG
jgi:hypothetical protein